MTRWSWRSFRRDWRQSLLVIWLISFAVAAAVFGATAAYNLTPSPAMGFGAATHRIELDVAVTEDVSAYIDAAQEWFGQIEVISHTQVIVPGSTERADVRSQAFDGPLGAPLLSLQSGRAPSGPGETAITDGLATRFGAGLGDRIDLDTGAATIVGLVENPVDLDDEFALVAPSTLDEPAFIVVLVHADSERVRTFRPPGEAGPGVVAERGQADQTTAAIGVLAVASVAMVLVCLVSGASFVTLAQRRLRQLGLFAAVGATQRQLRLAMVATGALVGLLAAALGTTVGVVAWTLAVPVLEPGAAHRIDRWNVPLWLLLTGALLALVTATAAAWWPARRVSTIPITNAISARPPQPRSARRSVIVAGALFSGGIVAITAGIDPPAEHLSPALFIPGVVAVVASVLVASAPVLRAVARLSGPLPVGSRLAVRDLARFETRSAAALGAITLALGIAIAVIVVSAADVPGAGEGNLATDQLIVWTSAPGDYGGLQVPEAVVGDPTQDRAVEEILGLVGDAAIIPLDVAVDPSNPGVADGRRVYNTAVLGRRVDEHTLRDSGLVFVASPEVIRYLGIDPAAIDENTVVLTRQTGDIYIAGDIAATRFRRDPVPPSSVARIDVRDHSSAPRTLITAVGLEATNLEPMRAGWLLDLPQPLDPAVLADALAVAERAGIAIEASDDRSDQTTVRNSATAAGLIVALCILAMTIGLLRSDAVHDMRTLAETGASRRTGRSLTATTSTVLAALGAVIGLLATYPALVASYWPDTDPLASIPVGHLTVIVIGLPLVAGAVGWMVGGREMGDLTSPGR